MEQNASVQRKLNKLLRENFYKIVKGKNHELDR